MKDKKRYRQFTICISENYPLLLGEGGGVHKWAQECTFQTLVLGEPEKDCDLLEIHIDHAIRAIRRAVADKLYPALQKQRRAEKMALRDNLLKVNRGPS